MTYVSFINNQLAICRYHDHGCFLHSKSLQFKPKRGLFVVILILLRSHFRKEREKEKATSALKVFFF